MIAFRGFSRGIGGVSFVGLDQIQAKMERFIELVVFNLVTLVVSVLLIIVVDIRDVWE